MRLLPKHAPFRITLPEETHALHTNPIQCTFSDIIHVTLPVSVRKVNVLSSPNTRSSSLAKAHQSDPLTTQMAELERDTHKLPYITHSDT